MPYNLGMTVTYIKSYVSKGKTYRYFRPGKSMEGLKPSRLTNETAHSEASTIVEGWLTERTQTERNNFRAHLSAMLRKARVRALKKELPFDLSFGAIEEMLTRQNFKCAVTGIAFQFKSDAKAYREPLRPSIDRIDSSKGYTPGNTRLVCVAVNVAIADWGDELFWSIVEAASKNKHGTVCLTKSR